MGVFFIKQCPIVIIIITISALTQPLFADQDSRKTPPNFGDIADGNPTPSPPTSKAETSPFKPSIAILVAILTTLFFFVFIILLYVKHCKRGNVYAGHTHSRGFAPTTDRKNSGIDRVVVESLPLFRFSSLRGQKEGLECAVCLNRFEPTELLRLLPKCKHAFHVECVDTWLDAHSTCPLCRYRVDPEDILLIEDNRILHPQQPPQQPTVLQEQQEDDENKEEEEERRDVVLNIVDSNSGFRRVPGRHSSAGESATRNPNGQSVNRHSLDSKRTRSTGDSNSVNIGCFDRPRKDGLLLSDEATSSSSKTSMERRLEHRIIVSGGVYNKARSFNQRWSDVRPSDLLYLRPEMLISDSRRLSSSSSSQLALQRGNNKGGGGEDMVGGGGRSVMNGRSVSEITGLSRFASRNHNKNDINANRQRETSGNGDGAAVSRWLGWIYPLSQPGVRSTGSAAAVTSTTTAPVV